MNEHDEWLIWSSEKCGWLMEGIDVTASAELAKRFGFDHAASIVHGMNAGASDMDVPKATMVPL